MYQRILVLLDGSIPANRLLVHLQGLAKAFGASLHLIQVVAPTPARERMMPIPDPLSLGGDYVRDKELLRTKERTRSHLVELAQPLEKEGVKVRT